MVTQALAGVRVLDLTHYIAGPYCTKLLADYGAEVIKIEKPSIGDGARRLSPFAGDIPNSENSGFFLYLNTNKLGTTLNLKSETGCKIFKDLVKTADILVENFRPGVMSNLNIGYEDLEKINPRLVMTSISNFGQTGPYRDFSSADIVATAMGGWMSIVGHDDREPLKPGGNQAQFVTGLMGAVGTMTAFHCQQTMDIGQHVDISIMESVLYIQMTACMYSYTDIIRTRIGNRVWPFPGAILPCKDGYIGCFAVTNEQWQNLCHWMGMPELIDDPRFLTPVHRTNNVDELEAIVISWLIEHEAEELFREGQKRRLPFAVPYNTQMLFESRHLQERGYFVDVDHPMTGSIHYPGAPFRLGDLPYQLKRAPLLGEHNHEIYCNRLGYTERDLIMLKERGVI